MGYLTFLMIFDSYLHPGRKKEYFLDPHWLLIRQLNYLEQVRFNVED